MKRQDKYIRKSVILNERIDAAVIDLVKNIEYLSPKQGYSTALRILAEKGIDALQEENQIEAKPAAG